MTGQKIAEALAAALRALLPGCTVREIFSESAVRRPPRPVLCVGVLSEAKTQEAHTAKIGVWLYEAKKELSDALLMTVQSAAQAAEIAAELSVSETKFDTATGCITRLCTVTVQADAPAVYVNGARLTTAGVTVSVKDSVRAYGAVGEESPPFVARTRTYTVALSGVAYDAALLALEGFAVSVGGVRYAPCTWQSYARGVLTFTAPHAEAVTTPEEGA